MRIVTANEWQEWLNEGDVLEKDIRGPKVLCLPDGRFLKIFRPRRRLWLARLFPAAKRFSKNAFRLKALKIAVPKIDEYFWVDHERAVSACVYFPLEGVSLAELYRSSSAEFKDLMPAFATFIRFLHKQGIYFRSLHLGNVLYLPDGKFGLIDFLDISFQRTPLSSSLRERNLRHLKDYLERREYLDFPWDRLRNLLLSADKIITDRE